MLAESPPLGVGEADSRCFGGRRTTQQQQQQQQQQQRQRPFWSLAASGWDRKTHDLLTGEHPGRALYNTTATKELRRLTTPEKKERNPKWAARKGRKDEKTQENKC